ncbi:MAG TPA: hypothetical protein DCR97_09100 [Deltaproteobacteria bacterium]|nr:hypothetical protein [Deltaproteobacteria bacterium]
MPDGPCFRRCILVLTRLAKRTEEFIDRLQKAIDNASDKSAKVLQCFSPFLTPDQSQQVAGIMREGRPASTARLGSIDKRMEAILVKKTVDTR